ncbi:MAG TPA: hypothetical protein EYP10_08360, partial [Armatimonadetes bacterium]|nr:hypothetical protein [Armatimonadota bacterium]
MSTKDATPRKRTRAEAKVRAKEKVKEKEKPKEEAQVTAPAPEVEESAAVVTQSLLAAANRAAQDASVNVILVCVGSTEVLPALCNTLTDDKCILAADSDVIPSDVRERFKRFVDLPSIKLTRLGQIKVAVLMALTRGLLKPDDVLICLTGPPNSARLDTLMLLSVRDEFELFTSGSDLLTDDIKPEVFERLMDIAIQLAVEGREGRPVGTMFVVGDYDEVQKHVTQLVLNPFAGYEAKVRNVLEPSLTETIKEFSAIDGAFI